MRVGGMGGGCQREGGSERMSLLIRLRAFLGPSGWVVRGV